jgi:hypothetical protein
MSSPWIGAKRRADFTPFFKEKFPDDAVIWVRLLAAIMFKGDIKYIGFTSSAAAPSTTEYPNSGNFGFHHDTGTPAFYAVANFSGTVKKVAMT